MYQVLQKASMLESWDVTRVKQVLWWSSDKLQSQVLASHIFLEYKYVYLNERNIAETGKADILAF